MGFGLLVRVNAHLGYLKAVLIRRVHAPPELHDRDPDEDTGRASWSTDRFSVLVRFASTHGFSLERVRTPVFGFLYSKIYFG